MVCDDILCPAPRAGCSQPIILEGECCATCQDDILVNTDSDGGEEAPGCYFDKGDHKKYHKAGTKWHPYIPPFGFSRCATCTCDANSLEVVCASKQCPPLDCPREQRVRPDKLACCMVGGQGRKRKGTKFLQFCLIFSELELSSLIGSTDVLELILNTVPFKKELLQPCR